MNCRYCHNEHDISICPKLDRKREREKENEIKKKKFEEDFPSVLSTAVPVVVPVFAYASVLMFKKDQKMMDIEKQEIERKNAEKEADKKARHDAFLLREANRARKKEKRERFINNKVTRLRQAFPFTWYCRVEDTEFDTDRAEELRCDLYRRENEEEERVLKEDEDHKKMLSKKTPSELEEYYDNLSDLEPDMDNYDEYNYRKRGIICKRCENSLEYDNRSAENYCFQCILDTI